MRLILLCFLVPLLAGCASSPDSAGQDPLPLEAPSSEGVVRTWQGSFNLSTDGATSIGPFYPHWPVGDRSHNCVQIVVNDLDLLSIRAEATWDESTLEEQQIAYHYLKDDPGPFRNANHTVGETPLVHEWSFDHEQTNWLSVGVHPQDGPLDRGNVAFTFNVTLTYVSDGALPQAEADFCVYQNNFLPGCIVCSEFVRVGSNGP